MRIAFFPCRMPHAKIRILMAHSYDTLMDRLAELAVKAVQDANAAVQAYWLACACDLLLHAPPPALTCEAWVPQALAALPLDLWAQGNALPALVQLLQDGTLLEGIWHEPLPKRGVASWEAFALYGDMVVQLPQAYQPYVDEVWGEASRLWQAACWLYGESTPAHLTIPMEVLRGAVLFEAGFYFACHEYFETLWGRTQDTASDFYQGLIQVTVAMCHLQSHNVRGALKLLHSGMARLQPYPDVYQGVSLGVFLRQLASLRREVAALSDTTAYQFDPVQIPCLLPDADLRFKTSHMHR
jgi:predicted metal-dependent hydrolase